MLWYSVVNDYDIIHELYRNNFFIKNFPFHNKKRKIEKNFGSGIIFRINNFLISLLNMWLKMPNTAGIPACNWSRQESTPSDFLNNTHQESNLVIIKQCVWLNVKNTYYEAHISLKSGWWISYTISYLSYTALCMLLSAIWSKSIANCLDIVHDGCW